MSEDQAFERATNEWLEGGSDRTPPHVADAVLLAVKTTPQERDLGVPRRFTLMPTYLRLAAGIAIVAVVGAGAFAYTNRDPGAGGFVTASPSPVPTASSTIPAPTPGPSDVVAWTTFTSNQYGFTIGHPDDWTVNPADRAWELETDAADWLSPAMDDFLAPTRDVRVSAWSVPLDPGTIVDETWAEVEAWVEHQYCESAGGTYCPELLDDAVRLCVEVRDCHPGLLVAKSGREVQAFFTGGIYPGQMVVVTVWRDELDATVAPYGGGRQLIEGFLGPMCVWPEGERPRPSDPSCAALR